ncbi:MAG: methionyl-tRNA formyltransferase [Chthoniobacterales bacterium]|nr:methionyl-tRNA formyltransferase [Chthoniobacterales bacterium]
MKIVFCGTGDIGLPSLHALATSECHTVTGVITQPDRPAGRELRPRASAVKLAALARGIPVVQPERIGRDFSALAEWQPDLMVVAAYGQILPGKVLRLPRLGCLNLHASLLPRHRGASPIQAAILAGDAESGITAMAMDEGLDTGDILLARRIPLSPDETGGSLHDRLANLAPAVLLEALELLETGSAPRIPQDSRLATYAPKLEKKDGRLDWNEPAELLARRVRAMNPWPGASARLDGNILKIHLASAVTGTGLPGTVLHTGPEGILVAAGAGSLLLREVQLEGRKRLPGKEFLRGFPLADGTKFDLSFSGPP